MRDFAAFSVDGGGLPPDSTWLGAGVLAAPSACLATLPRIPTSDEALAQPWPSLRPWCGPSPQDSHGPPDGHKPCTSRAQALHKPGTRLRPPFHCGPPNRFPRAAVRRRRGGAVLGGVGQASPDWAAIPAISTPSTRWAGTRRLQRAGRPAPARPAGRLGPPALPSAR